MANWPRIIVHADMDAFYAAVEQLDRPELRGKPLLIGHPGRRGVVSTASYEARPFGVGSAMPMVTARRLCPQAQIIPPRFARYQELSAQIMATMRNFSPLVEPLSLDEAFIDMSGSEGLFGTPRQIGTRIKEAIHKRTGLVVSVGIATTKYVAKVASDHDKPDGLTIVPQDKTRAFLDPLPVNRLWGAGPRSVEKLHGLGLRVIGDVANASMIWLERELGSFGSHIHRLALADDPRPVVPERQAKSIGHERTLEWDITTQKQALPHLLAAADNVAARLRSQQLVANGLRVKLKSAAFQLTTRQIQLPEPTNSATPLYEAACQLLPEFDWSQPLRLVGLAAYQLQSEGSSQLELFTDPASEQRADLDRAVDTLNERFGDAAVQRASSLKRGNLRSWPKPN